MVALRITKPWRPFTAETVDALPGQVGVYQLADAAGEVVKIGYAGGRDLFGLQSALQRELADPGSLGATQFRLEYNHNYMTRWEELLMVHLADHGTVPPGNADHPHPLGRLAPG